jgi:hypothetical protein
MPANRRPFNGADPITACAGGISGFRRIKHSESCDQSQYGKEERKSSELSEKLHLLSPPFFYFAN